MYNLFISNDIDDWSGESFTLELDRCLTGYTDKNIENRFSSFDENAVSELKRLPCIFGYETHNKKNPKFGVIRDITKRQGLVRIDYEIKYVDPFLSASDLDNLKFELDISKWELNRTHWAVKDINLPAELHKRGISLPAWTRTFSKTVDVTTHFFDIALSFPGEVRPYVEQIAQELERLRGPNSYFYDNNYVSQLAVPSLDILLQDIYRNRAKLIVVFIGSDYQRKDWCGIEFRAIRDILGERDNQRIMLVKLDEGKVEGIFKTDGYVDSRRFYPNAIAGFIDERVRLIEEKFQAKY